MPTTRVCTLVAVTTLLTLSACVSAGRDFAGEWGYAQSCGWAHTAGLKLAQTGNSVTGTWDDGTRVGGEDGLLKGEVREDKLFVQFCTEGGNDQASNTCPNYGETSAYLQRAGPTLAWYRKSGDDYTPYLVLHAATGGKPVPVDTVCEDETAPD